jgi:chemotaxis protein methyltransferase CheR
MGKPAARSELAQPKSWFLSHLQMRQIQALLIERSGLSYSSEKDEMLRRRIVQHIDHSGTKSFDEYLNLLKTNPTESGSLINMATINETFMFRDAHQVQVWFEKLAKPHIDQHNKITIWSAACSSGEEPATLSLLLDNYQKVKPFEFQIYASDINTEVIAKAKLGQYLPRAVKDVPPDLLRAFFTQNDQGYQLQQDVLKTIHYFQHNLLEQSTQISTKVDFLFLRNVMIYFDDKTRERIINNLDTVTRPGTYLMMGHCESPVTYAKHYQPFEEPATVIYRRT